MLLCALIAATRAFANPDGGQVVSGSATITQIDPKTLTINQQTDKAIINWRNFSIGAGEHTKFVQPSAASAVLNRVTSSQVSQILGKLTANGKVFLINPNGVVFGAGAQVDVGSLITSTSDIRNQDFLADTLRFTLAGRADARIVNQGMISVKEGGLVALVAPSIENSGVIYARLGRVALAAGNAVTIDPYGDDLITFQVPESVAEGLVDPNQNPLAALIDLSGDIIADGGGVLVTADRARDAVDRAINMTGYIQAKSLDVSGSKVVLDGGKGGVTIAGTIDASGLGAATGGEVRVVTDGALKTTAGSQILAEGGAAGGDGGFAAVSAWAERELAGRISVKANAASGENGWLYEGANTEAARTIRNPNLDGAGRVGSGANTVYFEANKGQSDESVDFLAHGSDDTTLFLSAADAVVAARTADGREAARLSLDGANTDVSASGEDKQAGVVNYYIGNDESKWVEGVETYKQVRYEGVYDGIDLIYYGNRAGNLEYDLQVAAGADAAQIKLDYSGAESVTKQANGDLVIDTGTRQVVQKAPLVYQETAEARLLVPGSYDVGADGKVSIKLDDYDRTKSLVVDPVIGFSSYHGGSTAENGTAQQGGVAVDASGNMYMTGATTSADFPTASAFDGTIAGSSDAYVTKVDSNGNLVYSTFLGGSLADAGFAIAVGGSGNAYVTGTTTSADFPTASAADGTMSGSSDAFVTALNSSGGALVYSTYLGGSAAETGYAIDVDSSGNAYVAGTTSSADLSVVSADQATLQGSSDAFVSVYTSVGAVTRTSYLGGNGDDNAYGIAVDGGGSGSYTVVGDTTSTDLSTVSAAQAMNGGGTDAMVVKYNPAGTKILSTYLGGTGNDTAYGVHEDGSNNVYVVGETFSADFTTASADQSTYGGSGDAFLTSYDGSGNINYSTYFGGSGAETGYGITANSSGVVFAVGRTTSSDLPTASATQSSAGGSGDGFVAGYSASGSRLFSTYLGGTGADTAEAVTRIDDNVIVAGVTGSSDFTTASAFQGAIGGSTDAFLTRFSVTDLFTSSTGTTAAQQTAQEQFIGRQDNPPPAADIAIALSPAPSATPYVAGAAADAAIGIQGQQSVRMERAVTALNSSGFEGAGVMLQGGESYTFAEQRLIFAQVEPTAVLGALEASTDTLAQQAQAQLAAVAEGGGPTLAEFSAWLDANNATDARSQTLVAMYLRMADAYEERTFAQALGSVQSLTTEIELADADADGGIGALSGAVLDEALSLEPTELSADATGGEAMLTVSAGLDAATRPEAAFIGTEPLTIDAEGRFQVNLASDVTINEATTITIVNADGSVSERPLFAPPDPARPVVAGTERIDRLADGRARGRLRLGDPATVRQVLVEGRPVPIGRDGRLDALDFPPEAVQRGYAAMVVNRADGTSTLTRLAITDEPPLMDAVVAPDAEGGLLGRAKAGDAAEVAAVWVDGEPVEVAEDGSFSFRVAASALSVNRSVDITIIYQSGAESHQALALDREPPLENLDSYRTGGGLRMVEGRLADAENVAELKIGNQIVPLEADGSFIAPVPEAAETADGFVPLGVVFADGTVAAVEVAPTPEPVAAEIASRLAEDGAELIDGRLAEPEGVAELRLGDTPVLFTADGRFSLSRTSTAINESFTLTIVYRDGTTRSQSLSGERLAARITDVVPVRTRDGRRITGRIADAGALAQVWAGGERLSLTEDGRFSVTLAETSFDAAESLDMTLVFADGSRLDKTLALRETPPIEALTLAADAAGNPALQGRLANPEDIAEVLVDGRPVPLGADGNFAVTQTTSDINRSVSVTIRHRDGSVTERRLAAPGRAVLADFRPAIGADGAPVIEDGKLRAAGRLADPDAVAALEVAGERVEVAADGGFVLALSETVVNVNESIDITVIFKDGSRAEERLALAPPPVADDLATITAADGSALIEGRLTETEDIAGVLVDGKLVAVGGDGRFRFARQIETQAETQSQTTTTTTTESTSVTTLNDEVSVTVLYADGRRAERRLALDAKPLLAELDAVTAADGALGLSAKVELPDDVAQVLVDGVAVALDGEGRFDLRFERSEINIERTISITIVFEDGTRRSQSVAVGTRSVFTETATRRTADGRAAFGGILENAENIAALRIDGRAVEVAADGSFEASLTRLADSTAQSVSVSIVYRNGARAERRVRLAEAPAVAEADVVTPAQGGALARWRLAQPETVAEVRIDGRPVPLGPDGRIQLSLSEAELNVTDNVSLSVIYRDGSRREERVQLAQREAVAEFATLAASETGSIVEGRITETDRVARVLVDGEALAIGEDGSFRVDMAERQIDRRRSLSLTIEYADGTRKVERLGVTAQDMFQHFEAVRAQDGRNFADGRVAEPGTVARVLVDGRAVELAQDGSFSLAVAETRTNINRDVNVTIVYQDGARVSRRVALRADAVLADLDVTTIAGGARVITGRLADAERIQTVSLGGTPIVVAADGSFRIDAVTATSVATEATEAGTRQLQITYRDGTRQAKTLALATGRALVGLDTYAAADGGGVIEGRLANAGQVAALFVDGARIRVGADGGFVYRKRSVSVSRSSRVSIRIVYRNGTVTGRNVAVNVTRDRAVMLVRGVSRTADGFSLMETVVGNAAGIAAVEIAGRRYALGPAGRLAFALPTAVGGASAQTPRVNMRVIYDNGLDAETWVTPARVAGGLIPLPRRPRRMALVIGNGRYGRGIDGEATANADAGLVGDMFRQRFGFEQRVLADASKSRLVATLRRLGRELGRNDQLVVHYAGRSITDRKNGRSYWLASDARAASAANWVSTDAVYRMLQEMGLRGAMVFSDAAFSVGRSNRTLRVAGRQAVRTPVQVVASGFGRPVRAVPDDAHSAFTWRLASTLSSIGADVQATNLFDVIRERLTRPRPTPPRRTAALANP